MRLLVCLVLPVLFTTVYSAASGRGEMKGPPPPGCACKCSGYVMVNAKGHEVGNCGKESTDEKGEYCFVELDAKCIDKKPNKITTNQYISYQACSAPDHCYDDDPPEPIKIEERQSADALPDVNASDAESGDEDFNRFTRRNCDCQCAGKSHKDKQTGQRFGDCETNDDTGSAWCYVDASTPCRDAKLSDKHGYLMSNEACTTPYPGHPLCKKMIRKNPFPYLAGDKKIANSDADLKPGAQSTALSVAEERSRRDCTCQCAGVSNYDEHGNKFGNCEQPDATGLRWCYVNDHGIFRMCPDQKKVKKSYKNLHFKSYVACDTPLHGSPLCSEADAKPSLLAADAEDKSTALSIAEERAPPPLNCDCQCHDYSYSSGGIVHGNCKSEDVLDNKLWCFVDASSPCRDKQSSQEFPKGHVKDLSLDFHYISTLSVSKEACTTPPASACKSRPPYFSPWAADAIPSVGEDMAAAEEPATNTNKKHVAVDITMHFKNHMSPNGDVSTALGTE